MWGFLNSINYSSNLIPKCVIPIEWVADTESFFALIRGNKVVKFSGAIVVIQKIFCFIVNMTLIDISILIKSVLGANFTVSLFSGIPWSRFVWVVLDTPLLADHDEHRCPLLELWFLWCQLDVKPGCCHHLRHLRHLTLQLEILPQRSLSPWATAPQPFGRLSLEKDLKRITQPAEDQESVLTEALRHEEVDERVHGCGGLGKQGCYQPILTGDLLGHLMKRLCSVLRPEAWPPSPRDRGHRRDPRQQGRTAL